jgi:hypothetical protein
MHESVKCMSGSGPNMLNCRMELLRYPGHNAYMSAFSGVSNSCVEAVDVLLVVLNSRFRFLCTRKSFYASSDLHACCAC